MLQSTIVKRFHDSYAKNDLTDCWNWTSSRDRDGYGRFAQNGHKRATRWCLEHIKGQKPGKGDLALHRCDNPNCVNPDHLYWGSHKQNAQDRDQRGRASNTPRTRKFTEETVQQVRADLAAGGTARGLAPKYGVSHIAICRIRRGLTWKTV